MDAFSVKGPDGITRSLSEHYDGMKDVEQDPYGAWLAIQNQAARIEALEQDLKAVLRREEDANRAAMKHLRALEQERIKSKNYADFNHEWRRRCEALERQVKAADALAAWVEGIIEDGCPLCGGDCSSANPPPTYCPQQEAMRDLAAYTAAKEGGA